MATLAAKRKLSSSLMLKAKTGARFQRQQGYGAFSVSESALGGPSLSTSPTKPCTTGAFRSRRGYRTFLRRYGVDFDERYVWD